MDTLKLGADANQYDDDFYTWTQRQAALIRDGKAEQADLANIAEEIETLGRAEISQLRSRYKILCLHLLEKRLQSDKGGRSWTTTIINVWCL